MQGQNASRPLLVVLCFFFLFGWIAFSRQPADRSPLQTERPQNWLFLREGRIPSTSNGGIEILVVGDIMPGRYGNIDLDQFEFVGREISTADFAIGNLEGVMIADSVKNNCAHQTGIPIEYQLLLPPESARLLQIGGFDVMGLANNHALDCGVSGLQETMQRLIRAGIKPVGAGTSPEAAYQPVYLSGAGLKIAILAINSTTSNGTIGTKIKDPAAATPADWETERALRAVSLASQTADFVMVSMHWGDEYHLHSGNWQRILAEDLISAGADFIFGHHPHVVQETQVIKGLTQSAFPGFVAYSLGNFMFDQYNSFTSQGLALKVFIDQAGLSAVQAFPVRSVQQPQWLKSEESVDLIQRIQPEPDRMEFLCNSGRCYPSTPDHVSKGGMFAKGTIDLTGDGTDEQIWLHAGRINIFSENKLVWSSPEEWWVVDLALGDPNDDGRNEILAAVNGVKDGLETSQPFILGFRGGVYRQLWGGSPVNEPIREVELGDIDRDGKQELVVIEERGVEKQAVTVWNWHGWGFSIFWRSPESRYIDLVIDESHDGEQVINVGLSW